MGVAVIHALGVGVAVVDVMARDLGERKTAELDKSCSEDKSQKHWCIPTHPSLQFLDRKKISEDKIDDK